MPFTSPIAIRSAFRPFTWLAAVCTALALVACGGGGGEAGPIADTLPVSLPPGGTSNVNTPSAPTVTFSGPARVVVGTLYTYSASSGNGASVTYTWGDGSPSSTASSGASVKKVWSQAGNFSAVASAGNGSQTLASAGVVAVSNPIAAGTGYTCAMKEANGITCWGSNQSSQHGNGTTTAYSVGSTVIGVTLTQGLSSGLSSSCAIQPGGGAVCWGDNRFGNVGNGTATFNLVSTPTAVLGLTNTVALAHGSAHVCAVRSDGKVLCWGFNIAGQLGNGSFGSTPVTTAQVVPNLPAAVAVAAGNLHTCALAATGSVYCWGASPYGQVGVIAGAVIVVPFEVPGLTDAVAISSRDNFTCALKANGTVACWGENSNYFTPTVLPGTDTYIATPRLIAGLTDAVNVQVAFDSVCALKANGTVACLGRNTAGQIGQGTTSSAVTTTSVVSGLSDVRAISAGYSHYCALKSNGAGTCWGDNANGQVVDPPGGAKTTPQTLINILPLWK
jgi:alpha-tubulin suppressor-like RCC1 family protein